MHNWLLNIIRRRSPGPIAALIRTKLFLLSMVYRLIVVTRNWAFDKGWFPSLEARAPVVSIGNLTVGGTGKTPVVIWLAKKIQKHRQPIILSRGYQSGNELLNDEGKEIQQRLGNVIQIQNSNRYEAANSVLQKWTNKQGPVFLLDDGFQHRQLCRNFDLILIDATNPFGFEHLLPRGLLREPLGSLRRAHAIVLTRCSLVDSEAIGRLKQKSNK